MRFEIDIFGDQQVKREILRVGENAENAAPAFDKIADYLLGVEKRQFASQGMASSGGWPPLAPSTIKSKGHGVILFETGRLRKSLTSRLGKDHIERISPHTLVFGTRVPYAKYHQLGTTQMPRRRVVELTEHQRKHVMKILQRWVVTGVL